MVVYLSNAIYATAEWRHYGVFIAANLILEHKPICNALITGWGVCVLDRRFESILAAAFV